MITKCRFIKLPAKLNNFLNFLSAALKIPFSTTTNLLSKLEQTKPALVAKPSEDLSPLKHVNNQLQKDDTGRLFAVVHLAGKQFKVTAGDIILVEGYWQPNIGDKIRLDKVLVVGAKDFSIIGRPIVQKELVDVQATIVEKSLTHTKTHFKKKRRKQYQRINFHRSPTTIVRINSIEFNSKLDQNSKKYDELEVY